MSPRLFPRTAGNPRPGFIRLLLGWALLLATAQAAADPPKVVVSVLPVHGLVAALMDGVGDPQLLLRAGQSPHGASLKPSQVRLLEAADLIIWIGPALERPLAKPIAGQRGRGAARIVTLMESDEITSLPGRHEHEHEHETEAPSPQPHDLHGQRSADPHLWLSVDNARGIVRVVARELARLDEANRARYAANARDLLARMERLRRSLRARLHGVADAPYVVFHDAYRYFEQAFGLRPAAALTVSPQRPPGARRVREIRRLIRARNIRCVFSEPQFPPGLVQTLVADTNATPGVLDPLGAALQPGPDAWFALMRGIADGLVDCLESPE